MGSLRNIVFVLCWTISAQALSRDVETLPNTYTMRLFAICNCRLSARMEYLLLKQDPGSVDAEAQCDAMAELLAAAVLLYGADCAMDPRLQASLAEAHLLQQGRG